MLNFDLKWFVAPNSTVPNFISFFADLQPRVTLCQILKLNYCAKLKNVKDFTHISLLCFGAPSCHDAKFLFPDLKIKYALCVC